MFDFFRKRRRARLLRDFQLPEAAWQSVLSRPVFHGLDGAERQRLKEHVIWFLHDKSIFGVGDYELSDHQQLVIAAQACLPILNLDPDSYADWKSLIVYPTAFVTRDAVRDAIGLVHEGEQVLAGQARHDGPVLLSWPDARESVRLDGWNVVIHEMAHKLDMRNGSANGFPPLHKGMSEAVWTREFKAAYLDFCRRVDSGEQTEIDAYASENPAEFFAVLSECFFETPDILRAGYPAIYQLLCEFYRQQPHLRLPQPEALHFAMPH
ncbi:M90 family metallopeptidase [Chitinivorax sp. PXF-14]|uniref:M90 family metallopeptidase n=1 Tax=Chitinivorax sp. PXF-14 TaxID=3230488 RepID=UPI003467BE3C